MIMNASQIKNIRILDFLHKIGIAPAKQYGGFYYFKAPYRSDSTPSLRVYHEKNIWFDLGTGTGGNIIDLACLIYSCNFKNALQKLSNENINSFSFQPSEKNNTDIEIKHIQPLQNKALIQYLQSRKIALPLAQIYLNEAYYKVTYFDKLGKLITKQYFALAFKNNSNGY
ncbi:MAG TPA: mobilization protein, partial [Bacteroidales bacterium]|nr:mobilization protein [Bacteroidales bacterium]